MSKSNDISVTIVMKRYLYVLSDFNRNKNIIVTLVIGLINLLVSLYNNALIVLIFQVNYLRRD
ncbi:adenylate/guanylate cyclase with integral membrane sensor [Ehrlichia ruminantium]|nr:adenylate/guanylate cyclase with integral membrane sensor [Ehrlichia ruminantium]